MKKIVTLFIVLAAVFSLSAEFRWGGVEEDWSLTLSPMDPLFKESRSYPFSNNVTFRYLVSPKDNRYLATDILVADDTLNGGRGGYKTLSFKDPDTDNNAYWNLKSAVNLGFMRISYRDIVRAEGYIHGGLNTVFGAYGGVDVLGFDGQYGAGVSASVYDKLFLRFGFHHFSGHWGDETIGDFFKETTEYYSGITEYTRNNSWLMNVSYQVSRNFRILAEFDLPMHTGWVRPAAHVPKDMIKDTSEESPDYGKPLSDYIYSQEGLDGRNNDSYPAEYRGWRIGLGAEATVDIAKVGYAYISLDVELHQDGKIDLDTLTYAPDRPWDSEYTIALGLSLEELPALPDLTIELGYHSGRFPLLNYFFQESRYFSAGLAVTL